MPGTPIEAVTTNIGAEAAHLPASDWIDATSDIGTADAAALTDPDAAAVTRIPLRDNKSVCRYARLRLKYDLAHTAVGTPPTVRVVGRRGGEWETLQNINGAADFVLTPNLTTDIVDATHRYSRHDLADATVALAGCDEIIVLVPTAMAATNGNVAINRVQVRLCAEI